MPSQQLLIPAEPGQVQSMLLLLQRAVGPLEWVPAQLGELVQYMLVLRQLVLVQSMLLL